jgi:uncharacterized OB-fold protein
VEDFIMGEKNKVPIIEGFFTWPTDDCRIIASRCKKCAVVGFPKRPFCHHPDCEKKRDNIEIIELNKKGILYSYTFQVYQPPEPFRLEPFKPYAIGMVDFPEKIRILGMITRLDDLKIGMEVETTVGTLYEDDENEYITWMWKPID